MKIKLGQYSVIDPNSIMKVSNKPGKPGKPVGGGEIKFGENTMEMEDIPEVGQETHGGSKIRTVSGGQIKAVKASDVTGKKGLKSKIYSGSKLRIADSWDLKLEKAFSGSSKGITKQVKELMNRSLGKQALIDWKKELKRFFDHSLKSMEQVLPNRRLVASGTIIYGLKRQGTDTLKTIVAAVDTSGSISQDQIKVFLNEVMYLCKVFEADKTYIIYCSDDIDGVDIVKKGGSPNLAIMSSTGGNAKGFIPPFAYVEQNKLNPSVFIYLTDTGGDMPKEEDYGIKKYSKKVIWFICSPTIYNMPPFGRTMYSPTRGIKVGLGEKVGRKEGEVWGKGSMEGTTEKKM